MLPVVHRCAFLSRSMAKPPSAREYRRIQRSQALSIRGSSFVNARSDRTRSIQFVERYFGWYRLSAPTHQPFELDAPRSEEHTSELQSPYDIVCRLLLEKKKKKKRV